ncbi:MAG: efflux RND transporter periplasmic adaptor subunit [Acidobacteria bacterium]|nr:efflux RND transporter periplasmic adaptor subunit [Acidobacteriota bacterium]
MKQRLTTAAALAALATLAGCHNKGADPVRAAEAPAVQAVVMKVGAEPFTATISVTGTLVSTTRVDVKAETIGHIVRFDKEEGDAVAAGETVVWLDEENYRLALRQAESGVQVSEAALAKARVMEAHGRQEYERAQNLLQSGGITDKDLKAAWATEQDSRAQAALAQAQLDQARAALEVTRKKLRDCQIHAPVAGEIQKKYVNTGAYVEAPTMLFSLVNNQKLELESPVATADLGPVRRGQTVTFTVNSFPGETFACRVIETSPAVDAETRSAKVRIRVNNSSGKLQAGMFAQGEILTGVVSQAIIIPASAVYRDDRSAKVSSVFVVEHEKAVRRQVRIGRERDGKLEIAEGLKPGDLLITEQSIELGEGVRVAPRESR